MGAGEGEGIVELSKQAFVDLYLNYHDKAESIMALVPEDYASDL